MTAHQSAQVAIKSFHDGSYIGTEWDSEFAHDYAAENNCKITTLPFDA